MNPTNVKIVFIAAIVAVLYGGFNIAKATYTSIAWTKTEGTILDFERNTWSCGKGVGTCYSLIIGYQGRNKPYTIISKKKFNHNKPTHLLNSKVTVYYAPGNAAEAVIAGPYGIENYGWILFVIGIIVLLVFWVVSKRGKD